MFTKSIHCIFKEPKIINKVPYYFHVIVDKETNTTITLWVNY